MRARHLGIACSDGAVEFPLFALAASVAHNKAYTYEQVLNALLASNRDKQRRDFIMPRAQ